MSFIAHTLTLIALTRLSHLHSASFQYGGHYVPVLASKLFATNRLLTKNITPSSRIIKPDGLLMQYLSSVPSASMAASPLQLRGIGIGDGWVDGLVQYQAYVNFSLEKELITPLEVSGLCSRFVLLSHCAYCSVPLFERARRVISMLTKVGYLI